MQKVPTVWNTSSATKLYRASCSHTWNILDYEERTRVLGDERICSARFYVERDLPDGKREKLTFFMVALLSRKLQAYDPADDGNIWIYLNSYKCGDRELKARIKYQLFILDKKDSCCLVKDGVFEYWHKSKELLGAPMAFSRDQITSDREGLLENGCLRVGCRVDVLCDCPQESSLASQKINMALKMSDDTVGTCFGKMLDDQKLSDVQLLCDGVKFKCHKLVLAARSDVFRAMFSHETTKEAITSEIEITDSSPDAVRQMLKFLYTDECEAMEDHVFGLMPLADKYNLSRLRLKCESWMADNICDDNAADILRLADMHNLPQLSTVAANYIVRHMEGVKKTEGWERMRKEWPGALAKLVETMSATGYPNNQKCYSRPKPEETVE